MARRRSLCPVLVLAALAAPARAVDGVDSPMFRDPEIPVAREVVIFPPGLADLWAAALDGPEADTQSRAALAIASAHTRGMPRLKSTVAPLLRAVNRPDSHPAVRLAASRALVALDAREAAPMLFKHLADAAPEYREIVEPVLARWDYAPARPVWLDRIAGPPPHTRGELLAIEALAVVREEKAVPRLRELVFAADVPPAHRLAAARALGEIRRAGAEADANRLAGDISGRGLVSRLAAAAILRQHQGEEAVRLLQALARDGEPAVAVAALTRLAEIDTGLILPVLDPVLASPDAAARAFGVEALARNPSVERVRVLRGRLDDPHPDVRVKARLAMTDLAGNRDLRAAVIERGERALAAVDWRGQEQAAILLARLGHTPAAGRMVELLRTDRPEVMVAAAWGLRELAVPATLPAVTEYVRAGHLAPRKPMSATGPRAVPGDALDAQLSQLIQLLGRLRHRPADDALRACIPRVFTPGNPALGIGPKLTPFGGETRAAAIWALGLIHENTEDVPLIDSISGRLTGAGDGPGPPDDIRVRRMAAVSLGRMKAGRALPTLRAMAGDGTPTTDVAQNACRWAVARLTGGQLTPPGTIDRPQRDWFLTPLK